MSGCARPARVTPTKAARCCSTHRRPTAGRRCWPWPTRWSAGSTGGRGHRPTRAASIVGALAGAQAPDRGQARPAAVAIRRRRNHAAAHAAGRTRSGAGATAARTGTSASPRTPTPTPCPSRSATRASTSWPTRAPTATTASAHGARTSGRRSRTTPPSSAAGASPARAVPSCGCVMRRPARSRYIDDGDIASWTAEHDGYASLDPPALAPPLGAAGPGLAQHRHRRRDRRRQPRHPSGLPSRS